MIDFVALFFTLLCVVATCAYLFQRFYLPEGSTGAVYEMFMLRRAYMPYPCNLLSFSEVKRLTKWLQKQQQQGTLNKLGHGDTEKLELLLNSFVFVIDYVENFLTKPHPEKGKSTLVCPFTKPAVELDCLYVAPCFEIPDVSEPLLEVQEEEGMQQSPTGLHSGPRVTTVSALIELIQTKTLMLFPDLPPETGSGKSINKALVLLFPQLENALDAIDKAQRELQPFAVARGLMVGEFHEKNATPGLHSAAWRPLRCKVPMLAVRHMVEEDKIFLQNSEKYSQRNISNMMSRYRELFYQESSEGQPSNQDGTPTDTILSPKRSVRDVQAQRRTICKRMAGMTRSEVEASSQLNQQTVQVNTKMGPDLDLSAETMKALTSEVAGFVSKYVEGKCHHPTSPVLLGGMDPALEDQSGIDAKIWKYLEKTGLGLGKAEGNGVKGGEPQHLASSASSADTATGPGSQLNLAQPPSSFSEQPCPNGIKDVLGVLEDCLHGPGINTAHTGYMGHIGGGGVFTAAITDYVLSAVNRQAAVHHCCPSFTRLEMLVGKWMCDLAGWESEQNNVQHSVAIFNSGTSVSTLSAITCAREYISEQQRGGEATQELIPRMTLYGSATTHGCIDKAWRILGFCPHHFRKIDCDQKTGSISLVALEEQIQSDIHQGLLPMMIVANAGATATGAVDDMEGTADLCKKYGIWFHVDAAYGFFYRLLNKKDVNGQKVNPKPNSTVTYLPGLHLADSIAADLHKSLGLPYGTGALLVKNHLHLRDSHGGRPEAVSRDSYLPKQSMALPANKKGVSNGVNLVNGQLSSEEPLPPLIDFCEYSVELSRPFRGLRAWVGLKLFGIDAFRANLQRLRSSALGLASQLDSDAVDTGCPGVRIVHWPELAIFTFKWEDLKKDQEEKNLQAQNQHTKELMASINCVENSVLLTSATVEKQFLIRVALSCFRTTEKDVEALLKNIKGARQKMM